MYDCRQCRESPFTPAGSAHRATTIMTIPSQPRHAGLQTVVEQLARNALLCKTRSVTSRFRIFSMETAVTSVTLPFHLEFDKSTLGKTDSGMVRDLQGVPAIQESSFHCGRFVNQQVPRQQ